MTKRARLYKNISPDPKREGWWVVNGKGPKWVRSAYVDKDGTVFLPYPATGFKQELRAVFCAGWDADVPIVESDGHTYFPATWAKEMALENGREDCAATCDKALKVLGQ